MKKIEYYHKNSDRIAYQKEIHNNGSWNEITYDDRGNQLTYKNSDDYWNERTYDENGNMLTYKNSNGSWNERTYDENGNELTYRNSGGYYEVKGESVTEEEFEAFTNPLLSKITE